jgi:peptidoglycan/LPS O-acetylase OafA/YrhL
MGKESGRLLALEGLRGVAAIVVVIFHALLIFYEYMVFGPSVASTQHMGLEDNLFGSPFRIFFAGTFAVAIFFVLSGFVLSIGFLSKGKKIILQKLALKRYLRLMLPALASVMIAWLLITLGQKANRQHKPTQHKEDCHRKRTCKKDSKW